MKGTKILVTSKPRGVFEDVYITGTPKPGTVMMITAATAMVGGVFNASVYTGTDGARTAIAVLLERDQDGSIYSDAYAAGEMGRLYFPLPGEKLNMLFEDVGGTGDDFAIGDIMMVDSGTGKLLATSGSIESEPFQCLEAVTDPMADHWVMCMATGQ
jgi:hypothetical protein